MNLAVPRASIRLVLLFVSSTAFCGAAVAGSFALRLIGRPDGRWRARVLRRWGRTMVGIIGVRLRVEGSPPETPFLLVSNHVSYLDIPVLAAAAGGFFVAKNEVASWPMVGLMARAGGTLFIDRDRKRDVPRVADAIEQAIARGSGVVLFPEGTSSDGSQVLRFRPPLLEPAARSGRGVHAVSVSYDVPAGWPSARTSVCWWGGMTLPGHVWRLLGLPWIEATLSFASGTVAAGDRKVLAENLNTCVRTLHRPVPP